MSGLRPPPSGRKAGSRPARLAVLILVLLVGALVVWALVTDQAANAHENVRYADLDVETLVDVNGTTLNVVEEGRGGPVYVLLHGFDVSGSAAFDGLVEQMGEGVHTLRVDLPGFGLSQRFPEPGPAHTVTAMGELVAEVVANELSGPAVFVGVGLGGEVAAQVAVTNPDLVAALVLVDVDFYSDPDLVANAATWPVVGRPVAFAFDSAGSFADDRWAPGCADGDWCPSASQKQARERATRIVGTSASLAAFYSTPGSALVPPLLADIDIPVAVIWSQHSGVPQESVQKIIAAIPDSVFVQHNAWHIHLEDPAKLVENIDDLIG